MPPAEEEQPAEPERMRLATRLDRALRETARDLPDFAGTVTARRLNRLEYDNSIRTVAMMGKNAATCCEPAITGTGV